MARGGAGRIHNSRPDSHHVCRDLIMALRELAKDDKRVASVLRSFGLL